MYGTSCSSSTIDKKWLANVKCLGVGLGVVSESVSECLGVGLGVDGVETASASE